MEYHYVLTEPGTDGEVPETNAQVNQENSNDFTACKQLTDRKLEADLNSSTASNGDMEISNDNSRYEMPSNNKTIGDNTNSDTVSNEMIGNGDMMKDNDMITDSEDTSKLNNGNVGSEKFDLSKVKSENTEEEDMYGTSTENEDYNLDVDTETEDNGESGSHSKSNNTEESNDSKLGTVSKKVDQENIKPEVDTDMQVIVLNKHNKFNARPKPDPSVLRHECDKCDDAFQFPYQLARHKNIKHEGKYPYYCDVCKKPFDRSSSLRDHMYVHTDSRPFECKQCDKSFKMKGNLRKHIRDMHTEIQGPKLQFQCEYCSKIFPTKERLTSHFLVHDPEKPFACNVCGKRFNRKNNLKEHVVIHSTEKNFVCPDCGMRFNRKYSLKIHARNHMAVKPYKCELCPSSFSQLHALKTHFRLHTGEKPFKCTICEKTFRQLATLQVHFKRHTGVKDFKCGICGKGFVIKRRLIEHERLHTGEKPFSCDLCPYRAATSSGLRLHKKTHVRQMERLAMQQVEGILNEESENTESVNKKRKITRKSRLPPLSISTKLLTKNSAETDITNTVDTTTDQEKVDNVESDVEDEMMPVVNGEAEPEEGTEEVPENFSNESLIEIVNDIADADIYPAESAAEIENVNDETESSININYTGITQNFEIPEPHVQVSETESIAKRSEVGTKGKSVKRPSKTPSKPSPGKEIEFENLTKEVLYKHLNEFIPAIDADVLAEKVDLITKELFEIHGKPATKKATPVNTKKSRKKPNSDKVNKNDSNNGPIQMDTGGLKYSLSVTKSCETMGMSTFATQTMFDEIPTKTAMKPTNPHRQQAMNTSVTPSDNRNLIRQLLSTSTPKNTRPTMLLPTAMSATNRGDLSKIPFGTPNSINENHASKDKLFLSSTLRNMLSTKKKDHTVEQTVTMATAGTSVKKENPSPVAFSPAGSSAVLRDMLSTPPKHYLISTKNSYAALQHSIKRQNAVVNSQNGFQGQWYTTDNTVGHVGESDFPWVDRKDPQPTPDFSVSNIKVEPISP